MKPKRIISYVNETPVAGPIDMPDATPVNLCLRTADTYLKRRSDIGWANARMRDRTVTLTAEEAAEKPALAGDWTLATVFWGLQFSGGEPTLILDLEKAGS